METLPSYPALQAKAKDMEKTHLRDLLRDETRNNALTLVELGVYADFSRQKLDTEAFSLLLQLAEERQLKGRIEDMFSGKRINSTEDREVLHVALREGRDGLHGSGVWQVLDNIKNFVSKVRSGEIKGITGKPLTNVVSIGIGGSYLGPEFLYEALATEPSAAQNSQGRKLKFLANVDPTDMKRALKDCDPERTLFVIVSKTFTTAETILNAKAAKEWLIEKLGNPEASHYHMCAVSTNIKATSDFGIDQDRVFQFWDWVGGRYSVSSAVGVLPLSLHYGFEIMNEFLKGANAMDRHFRSAPLAKNIPVLLGLIGVWNASFLHHDCVAILPYAQALLRFPAHIQQLAMESNGKQVTIDGVALTSPAGQIFFGEPGTNGQHSFYQLLHQGRTVPSEFIGFCKSPHPIQVKGHSVTSHEEFMTNFFAQPDALALGLTKEQLIKEKVPDHLLGHKEFSGDRMSVVMLLENVDAYNMGKLLALYEHRVVVEGFMWGINSFDQWGVQLGKTLASKIRSIIVEKKSGSSKDEETLLGPTRTMLSYFLQHADASTVPIA